MDTQAGHVENMIPSNIIFFSDQMEISGDFIFKCRIDNPVNERIVVRDYIYEMAKKEIVDYYEIVCNDILELTETYFKVDEKFSTPFENYMVCTFLGKFKMTRRAK